MFNPNNPSVQDLQAEIDRLNSELSARSQGATQPSGATPADVNATADSGPSVYRAPGSGATIVGAAADPRGGTVLGYSDGTAMLINVPANTDGSQAEPWGTAPEGEYVAFYVTDDGNTYHWVSADGKGVTSVENPNQARP